MAKDYIEKRETGYYVIGSRIPIDTIVTAFLGGDTPETLRTSFPTLTLKQVYGGFLFYLENRDVVEASMKVDEESLTRRNREFRDNNPARFQRLEAARRVVQSQKQR